MSKHCVASRCATWPARSSNASCASPLHDTRCGGLSDGTAARKLGAGHDMPAPGKRRCPCRRPLAQELLSVILDGEGTLRVAGGMPRVRAGGAVFVPPGTEVPHQFVSTSDAPMKALSISTQQRPEPCEVPARARWRSSSAASPGTM